MSGINLNNLWTRALTGVLFVVSIIGSVLLSHLLFSLLFLIVTVLAMYEFYRLFEKNETIKIQVIPGIIAGSIVYLTIALVSLQLISTKYLLLNLLLPIWVFIIELYRKTHSPIQNISLTLLGVVYVSIPLAILNLLFNPQLIAGEHHPEILICFFVILWTSDTFAYLTGMLLGRNKLFERISPKKTWEGSIGGFVFGLIAAFVISYFYPEFGLINWLIIASIIMIFGAFGDLTESMFKRSSKIKDSGNILPGHGGMLDRFDAALLAAPAIFVYINLVLFA